MSAAAVVVAAGLLAASCSGSSKPASTQASADSLVNTPTVEADAGPVQEGGVLTYALSVEANSLNPTIGEWTASTYTVANAIFDPLAALGTDGKVKPYLAKSFTPNADFTEWTIGLRDGIRFQNGQKLDAAAVKLNFDLMAKSALAGAVFVNLTDVQTPDDRTVQLFFSKPWSTFPSTLILQPGYMAAPAMLLAPNPATADPVGTGPFTFESHKQGQSLRVVKNKDYWQAALPHLAGIDFRFISDSTLRGEALSAGDVDMIEVFDSALLKKVLPGAQSGEIHLLTNAGQEADETVIALNTAKAPFDDLVARQALAYAINQESISQIAYNGLYPAAWGNFEKGSPYYIDRKTAGYPSPDPAKARKLAEQYQREHGQPLAFSFKVNSDPTFVTIAEYLQQTLKEVGIDMKIETGTQTANITSVIGGDYQASTFAMWSAPTLDKGYPFVASKPVEDGISLNYTQLYDPKLVAAMDEARATDDQATQIAAWAEAQKRMAANLDRIFLVHTRWAIASIPKVHGYTKTTFPGTENRAFAPTMISPFMTSVWIEQP